MNQTDDLLKQITSNLKKYKNAFPEEHQARLILQICKDNGLVFLIARGSYGFEAEFEELEL